LIAIRGRAAQRCARLKEFEFSPENLPGSRHENPWRAGVKV